MQRRKIDDEKLQQLIDEGKSGIEIARFFGCSPALVTKHSKRLQPLPESLSRLTPKQREFCVSCAEGKSGTEAALSAFDCGSREVAKQMAMKLKKKPEIECCITELMQEAGLTKRYRLQKLRQHIDSRAADISLKALDQSWKVDRTYAPEGGTPSTVYNYTIVNLDLIRMPEAEQKVLLSEIAQPNEEN